MNTDEKSLSRVADLIKAKYHPEQYAAEQKAKEEHLKETLAFVEGVKAALALQEEEEAKNEDIKKSNILFKTDPLHPRGWSRNK